MRGTRDASQEENAQILAMGVSHMLRNHEQEPELAQTRMDSQGTDRGAHLFSATPAWVCGTLLEGTASLRTDEDLRRMQSATAWRMRACPCIVTRAVRDPAVSKGAGIFCRDSLIP
jgi:hypothetical protein